jgi:hypothetical protein
LPQLRARQPGAQRGECLVPGAGAGFARAAQHAGQCRVHLVQQIRPARGSGAYRELA